MNAPQKANARVFAEFCAARGFDPESFTITQVAVKKDRRRFHAVTRFHRDGSLGFAVKSILKPQDVDDFEQRLRNHQAAQEADIRVPYLHHIDKERQATISDWVDGQTLAQRIQSDSFGNDIKAAGAWLGEFHRKTGSTKRAFQSRFMHDHLMRLESEATNGDRKIAKLKAFSAHLNALKPYAFAADGASVRSALAHGDFNARNVLIGPESIATAIDFGPYRTAPVVYDIARLLVHLASLSSRAWWCENYAIKVPVLTEFLDGYGGMKADDPVLQFLLRVRILIDWAAMHDSPMSWSKRLRLRRLYRGAQLTF